MAVGEPRHLGREPWCHRQVASRCPSPGGCHGPSNGGNRDVSEMRAYKVSWNQVTLSRISPKAISFSAAISACEASNWQMVLGSDWKTALGLLGLLLSQRLQDPISFNAAMSACEESGKRQTALLLLRQMPVIRLSADVISCNATISACAKRGEWQLALCLLWSMPEARLVANAISYSAAISACEKGAIGFNAAISACEKRGIWQIALHLLSQMPAEEVSADVISCNAVISACVKGGDWDQALLGLSQMCSKNFSQT
eukprot:s1324_g9.t1